MVCWFAFQYRRYIGPNIYGAYDIYAAYVPYKEGICDMHGLYASFLAPVVLDDLLNGRQPQQKILISNLLVTIYSQNAYNQL
ncbi:hypothetical protein M514_17002 [Trichuris suis]|uniref:Uncharacterized protein n=1 Tax=Trichuris suis TaxID=68888 RepID=A0A085NN34_9BILA|nr:hypothetical protein M514_17002 [Trichuris suis]